jgi:transcriptional regulator with XRE-family HTH domain
MLEDINYIPDDFSPVAISKKIAGRMRQKRLALNLTQQKLSGMSGVSLGSLKRFENQYKISLEHLLKLALVLDALEGFHHLFPGNDYQNIDDLIKSKNVKNRKRARSGKAG